MNVTVSLTYLYPALLSAIKKSQHQLALCVITDIWQECVRLSIAINDFADLTCYHPI